MSYKLSDFLVVSDVDGTLLQAGFGIPKDNIDTIEEFTERGGLFTVATDRGIESVSKYTDWIKLNAPAILCNGGMIYDFSARKIISELIIDSSVKKIIKSLISIFPDLGVEVTIRDKIYALRMNEQILQHTSLEHISFALTDIDIVADEWNMALLSDEPGNLNKIQNFIEKRKKTDPAYAMFDFVRRSPIYYTIVPKGANKAEGLRKLAGLQGIDVENTVAIGDHESDLDMMEIAGLSAAVEDAAPEVKSAAKLVVSSCLGGGVADVLKYLISKFD